MIHKSSLIEQNIEKIINGITLFYGENLGLINDFKELIKKLNNNSSVIRLNEEEIIKKNKLVQNEPLYETIVILKGQRDPCGTKGSYLWDKRDPIYGTKGSFLWDKRDP